jgi:hypothetical protein
VGKQDWSRRDTMMALGIPIALTQSARSSPYIGAQGIPQTSSNLAFLPVTDMGAVGDGRADDTRAFQKTVDRLAASGGGTMILPPGQFRTGTIHFPYAPAVVRVIGAGTARSVWEMAMPTQPIIAIDPSDRSQRSVGGRFEGFTVRAHADGLVNEDSHIAINCAGFSDVTFQDIRFQSNKEGSVGSLFHTSAHPQLSYHQQFRNIVCEKNIGPGSVVKSTNAGDYLTNTNIICIEQFWIYANEKMQTALDLHNSTSYIIRSGLIESSGANGIRLGNSGCVESVWIEDTKEIPLVFESKGSATSSNNTLRNVYLSGFSGELKIPRDCTNNIFLNVSGGNFKVIKEDYLGGNILINSGGSIGRAKISQFFGSKGKLRQIQSYRASGLSEKWNILCEFTPENLGNIGLRVVPPAGSHLSSVHASALIAANGTPCETAGGWPIGDIFIAVGDKQPIAVIIQLTLE